MHHEMVITNSKHGFTVESTLDLGQVEGSMFCNYTCTAANNAGSDSHTIVLTGYRTCYINLISRSEFDERLIELPAHFRDVKYDL